MRLSALILTFLVASGPCDEAMADMTGIPAPPSFDDAERVVIASDDLLGAIVGRDPWLVRHILDVGARGSVTAAASEPVRRDATGSVEWIDLVRRAKAERDRVGVPAPRMQPSSRTSEGSVEMFELMKQARQLKISK